MPSRAEMRVLIERVLRGVVIVALATMLWQSRREEADSAGRSFNARGAVLNGSLREWTTSSMISNIRLELESIPSPIERVWLGALGAAAGRLTWSGNIPSTMIDAQR